MESILITGASGFIGSFIVEEALKRKFGVWAGIRSSSSRAYLRNRDVYKRQRVFRIIRTFYSTSAKSNCFFSRLARATLIVIASPKL